MSLRFDSMTLGKWLVEFLSFLILQWEHLYLPDVCWVSSITESNKLVPGMLCLIQAFLTMCLSLELGPVINRQERPRMAHSESEQTRMLCLLFWRPRKMSFQATGTRRVNRKVNSRLCVWPVMISDDWVGSKWKWNHKRMTGWEEGSQPVGRAWEEGFAPIQHSHRQAVSTSVLRGAGEATASCLASSDCTSFSRRCRGHRQQMLVVLEAGRTVLGIVSLKMPQIYR